MNHAPPRGHRALTWAHRPVPHPQHVHWPPSHGATDTSRTLQRRWHGNGEERRDECHDRDILAPPRFPPPPGTSHHSSSHRTHRANSPQHCTRSNGDDRLAAAAARHRLPPARLRLRRWQRGRGSPRGRFRRWGRAGSGSRADAAAGLGAQRGERSGRAGPRLARGRYVAASPCWSRRLG
jgi:hypothetical protein